MAFMLDTATLNALLAKGFISSEFHDRLSSADNQKKVVEEASKNPPTYELPERVSTEEPEDQRLAENTRGGMPDWAKQPMMTPQQVADWTNAPVNAQGQTPVMPKPQDQPRPADPVIQPPPGGWREDLTHKTPPGVVLQRPPTEEQLLWQMNQRPGAKVEQPVVAPNGVIIKPTQSQIAGFRAIEEEAKKGVPPDQVAGNKGKVVLPPTQPTQPTQPVAPARTGGGGAPAYKGPGNTAYGPPVGQEGKFLSPGEMARQDDLNTAALAAQGQAKRAGELDIQEAEKIAQLRQQSMQEDEARFRNQQVWRDAYKEKWYKDHNDLYSETEAWGKRNIDPDEAWKKGVFGDNVTGNKILGGIAIALGALGQGATMAGGHGAGVNQGMQAIDNAINQSIAKQRFSIEQQGESIKVRKGLLNDRMNQFKDMDAAEAAARVDYWNMVERKVKTYVSENASERAKIALDDTIIGIDNKRKDALFQFSQTADQRARAQANAAAAAQAQMNNRLLEEYKGNQAAIRKAWEEGRIVNPDGSVPSLNDALRSLGTMGGGGQYTGTELLKSQGQGGAEVANKLAPLNATLASLDRAEKDYKPGGALAGLDSVRSTALAAAKRTTPGKVVIPENILQAEQNFDAVTNEYIHNTTGAALNKEGNWEGQNAGEAARLLGTIKGDGSAAARQHGIKIMREGIMAQKQTYLQGSPGVAKRFEITPPKSQEEKDKALGAQKNK